MKRVAIVMVLVLSFVGFSSRAAFPEEKDEPLKFNEELNDKKADLEAGKLEPEVRSITDGLNKYFQLDYSELITLPLAKIKLAIEDFESYPCYMPRIELGQLVPSTDKGSKTDPTQKIATAHFVLSMLFDFKYYLDLSERLNTDTSYGLSWVQNHDLHKARIPAGDVFVNHVGSWYVEFYDKTPQGEDRHYVRYRDTVHLALPMPEAAYRRAITKNTKLMFSGGKDQGMGLYNYSNSCPKLEEMKKKQIMTCRRRPFGNKNREEVAPYDCSNNTGFLVISSSSFYQS